MREDKEHWVFVWQALLANDQHLPEGWDLAKLIQLGCEWLAVRENEDHWAFVWQALLANEQHLPEGWDLAGLVRLGRERLGGREGKDEWAFVWRELLAKATCLADGWDLARLVRLGCEWLGGREGMDQWTYVWQALLANGHCLPKRWDLARLVRLGCEWLDGRGDKDQWAFVWRALLANAKRLPEGWDQARLVRLGCEWLEGRESQDSWSYVWGLLLDHEAEWADELRMAEMVTLGETWLGKHLYTDSAPVVMSRLLRLTERVPFRARQRVAPLVGHWAAHCEHYSVGAAGRVLEDMADVGFARVPQVEASGIAWCQANAEHPAWIIVVVKFLCFTSGDAQWDRLASDMAGLVISHPNLVVRMLDEAERLMRQASRHARSPAFSELLGALARRAQAPQWAEARAWLEQKTCLEAVICIGPKSMTLCKLPNGLYAAVNGIKKGSHLRPDEICLVRLDDLAPEVGLVHVSLVNQKVGQG